MGERRKIAVIGLGMAVTPHARSLVDLADRVEVVGCFSRSEARRAAFAAKFPSLPVTGDLDRLIGDPDISAVLLLTPANARAELVGRLAAAGKHILMEKPIERTTAAAEQLVRTCKEASVRLGIVFQFRYRPTAIELRRRLEQGQLGRLALAVCSVPWWRPQAYYDEPGRGTLARDGGGVLISQAIHALDFMLSLVGPVRAVTAMVGRTDMHRMETEDVAVAGLELASGALGSVLATTALYPGGPERLDLVGTAGTATLIGDELVIRMLDGREERLGQAQGTGGGADPMAFAHDWHRSVIVDFLDALDQGREPTASGAEALRVHRLIDAIIGSSADQRRTLVAPD